MTDQSGDMNQPSPSLSTTVYLSPEQRREKYTSVLSAVSHYSMAKAVRHTAVRLPLTVPVMPCSTPSMASLSAITPTSSSNTLLST